MGGEDEIAGALKVLREPVRDFQRGVHLMVVGELTRRDLAAAVRKEIRVHLHHRAARIDRLVGIDLDLE